MSTIQLKGYKTSRDYKRLAEVMKTQSVICIVDYFECRDICKARFQEWSTRLVFDIGVRGHSYICGFTEAELIEQCEKLNVEVIFPDEQEGAV